MTFVYVVLYFEFSRYRDAEKSAIFSNFSKTRMNYNVLISSFSCIQTRLNHREIIHVDALETRKVRDNVEKLTIKLNYNWY